MCKKFDLDRVLFLERVEALTVDIEKVITEEVKEYDDLTAKDFLLYATQELELDMTISEILKRYKDNRVLSSTFIADIQMRAEKIANKF